MPGNPRGFGSWKSRLSVTSAKACVMWVSPESTLRRPLQVQEGGSEESEGQALSSSQPPAKLCACIACFSCGNEELLLPGSACTEHISCHVHQREGPFAVYGRATTQSTHAKYPCEAPAQCTGDRSWLVPRVPCVWMELWEDSPLKWQCLSSIPSLPPLFAIWNTRSSFVYWEERARLWFPWLSDSLFNSTCLIALRASLAVLWLMESFTKPDCSGGQREAASVWFQSL